MTDEPIEELLAKNVGEFMEHGPGLRITTRVWVAGRDRTNGYLFLSGLGGMGIGSMWGKDDGHCADYSGYDDAPDVVTEPGNAEHPEFTSERRVVSGDWDAVFARTAMGMMSPPRAPQRTAET